MRRSGLPRRRVPLRRVSPKRLQAQREYTRLRAAFLDAHSRCERCGQRATDVHHRRGRVGVLYLDTAHWSALCRACHRWATDNPAEAVASGYSELRLGGAA